MSHAKTHLAEMLHRVQYGERIIIVRRGRPVAGLVSIEALARIVRLRRRSRATGLNDRRPGPTLAPPPAPAGPLAPRA